MKILLPLTAIHIILLNIYAGKSSNENYDSIQQYQFDSKLNSYIVVFQGGDSNFDRLYKYNNQSSLQWKMDFFHIWKVLINKQDDVYLFVSDVLDQALGKQTVWLLKTNSNKFDFLFQFDSKGKYNDPSYFIDQDGNIYFNTRSGVAVLRPGNTSPVWVVNLEKFNFDKHEEDADGNVYLRNSELRGNAVAIITKESKQASILTGSIVSIGNNDIRENLNNGGIVLETLKDKNIALGKVYIILTVIIVVLFLTIIAAAGRMVYILYMDHQRKHHRTSSYCHYGSDIDDFIEKESLNNPNQTNSEH